MKHALFSVCIFLSCASCYIVDQMRDNREMRTYLYNQSRPQKIAYLYPKTESEIIVIGDKAIVSERVYREMDELQRTLDAIIKKHK